MISRDSQWNHHDRKGIGSGYNLPLSTVNVVSARVNSSSIDIYRATKVWVIRSFLELWQRPVFFGFEQGKWYIVYSSVYHLQGRTSVKEFCNIPDLNRKQISEHRRSSRVHHMEKRHSDCLISTVIQNHSTRLVNRIDCLGSCATFRLLLSSTFPINFWTVCYYSTNSWTSSLTSKAMCEYF